MKGAILLVVASITFAWQPSIGTARQASIHGIVTDRSTGQPIGGVDVALAVGSDVVREGTTDRNGFYQIGSIDAGAYMLRTRFFGYVEHEAPVVIAAGERLTISVPLDPDPLIVQQLVVSPAGGMVQRELGRQRVTARDLGRVPTPSASGDLANYLQTLPGVVATGDRGGQLFVRGGTAAENMVLGDGVLIYRPFHILGFFSAFPQDLVSNADFYAAGFGPRYSGRTSSVLDVQMRDGSRAGYRATGSVSPILAEAVVEGPLGGGQASWVVSARRSLIEETSRPLLGNEQPLEFESQFARLSSVDDDTGSRCSALGLRTSDRGRLDAEDEDSWVGWENLAVGGRCVILFERVLRLLEATFSYSSATNMAMVRGASELRSRVSRIHHEAHTTNLIGAIPLYAGYSVYAEILNYDLTELFGLQRDDDAIFGVQSYAEVSVTAGERLEMRPGAVLTFIPRLGIEPRMRASWQLFGRPTEEIQAAIGLYRQDLTGVNDMRDVGSVFVAWTQPRDDVPLQAVHATLGWQQSITPGLQWLLEAFYKRIRNIPVPVWRATAAFDTDLSSANGRVYGAEARLEYSDHRMYAFAGYALSRTRYEAAQEHFGTWFGDPVLRYHPPHDRRHQVSAMFSLDLAGFTIGARWQFGSGLPFTQPLGFDEAFDFRLDLEDVTQRGTTRLLLDRPYQGRLPAIHRLDLSLRRPVDLAFGRLELQAGAMNVYDRRNMFYYDLHTARRVDQLPLVPYASLKLVAH